MIIALSASISAATMTPVFGYNLKFTRGVGNVCFWIDSTASKYSTWINNAASLWEYNGYANPIYIQEVDSDYATHMDFYGHTISGDSRLSANTNGYTELFDDKGQRVENGGSPWASWFYADIVLNKSVSTVNQSTAVHEMGHAFGLAHNASNTYSIMYPYASDRKVSSPQECDVAAINYLYDY